MPKFKVDDQVERIGELVPEFMKHGTVLNVFPSNEGQEWFTQYEVDFGDGRMVGTFYETQLRLITEAKDSTRD